MVSIHRDNRTAVAYSLKEVGTRSYHFMEITCQILLLADCWGILVQPFYVYRGRPPLLQSGSSLRYRPPAVLVPVLPQGQPLCIHGEHGCRAILLNPERGQSGIRA